MGRARLLHGIGAQQWRKTLCCGYGGPERPCGVPRACAPQAHHVLCVALIWLDGAG